MQASDFIKENQTSIDTVYTLEYIGPYEFIYSEVSIEDAGDISYSYEEIQSMGYRTYYDTEGNYVPNYMWLTSQIYQDIIDALASIPEGKKSVVISDDLVDAMKRLHYLYFPATRRKNRLYHIYDNPNMFDE